MQLRDELFKLYQPVQHNANLFVRCRHHPVQLRIVAKARYGVLLRNEPIGAASKFATDLITYRNYID
jgi:hypothetical protein